MSFWPVTKRVIKDSDILLLVADVRMPEFSRNKGLQEMADMYRKPIVLVFNKQDLVTLPFLNSVKVKYPDAFFVSGTQNTGISNLRRNLFILAKRLKIESPRIGVVGYPNVGKSAIINALAKRARTKVSAHAGTTKGIQWVKSGGLFILDSPGVIPFEDSEASLGILGSKNPEKLRNVDKVGTKIVRMFMHYNPKILENLYGISISDNETNVLEEIGRKKGLLLKGGIIDEHRAAIQVLRDWQKGKLRL